MDAKGEPYEGTRRQEGCSLRGPWSGCSLFPLVYRCMRFGGTDRWNPSKLAETGILCLGSTLTHSGENLGQVVG